MFSWIFGLSEKELEKAFELGKEAGLEEGRIQGMALNFERSKELTEEEYKEVIDFLVKRKLELCCYDVNKGGFKVRKRIN